MAENKKDTTYYKQRILKLLKEAKENNIAIELSKLTDESEVIYINSEIERSAILLPIELN